MLSVKISPLNGLRFVPEDMPMSSRYNTPDFDWSWQGEQVRSWEQSVKYAQKVERGDVLSLQIWSSGTIAPTISIYDCSGKSRATSPLALNKYAPVIKLNGVSYYIYEISSPTLWSNAASNSDDVFNTFYARVTVEN